MSTKKSVGKKKSHVEYNKGVLMVQMEMELDIFEVLSNFFYIKNLGVDIIWLSPVYQTLNDDNGYYISDYNKIEPEFGTMIEFDEMLKRGSSKRNETHHGFGSESQFR